MSEGPKSGSKTTHYTIEDGTLVRKAEFCPECGPGVFLAAHADRKSCGRCGHTQSNE
jgi:small subunit ribosomal protein S27Ae